MSKKKEKKNIIKKLKKFFKRNALLLFLIFIAIFIIGSLLIAKKNKIEYLKAEKQKTHKQKIVNIKSKIESKEGTINSLNKNSIVSKKDIELNDIKIINKEKITQPKLKQYKYNNCNDILKSGKKESGIYDIFLKNSNETISVYCDMETAGGGWTLLLTSSSAGWKYEEVISKKFRKPSIKNNYSILGKADDLKTVKYGKFQYRIDAKHFGQNGGIWEVPLNYSFLSKSSKNEEIKIIKKFGKWEYYTFGLEKRMPYLCDSTFALLTTSINCSVKWFGTLVAKGGDFIPAPWIHNLEKEPGIIWYWVK